MGHFFRRLLEVPEKQLPLRGVDLSQRPTRESLCEELRRIPGGPDPALLEAMQRGVAFHHAGPPSALWGLLVYDPN